MLQVDSIFRQYGYKNVVYWHTMLLLPELYTWNWKENETVWRRKQRFCGVVPDIARQMKREGSVSTGHALDSLVIKGSWYMNCLWTCYMSSKLTFQCHSPHVSCRWCSHASHQIKLVSWHSNVSHKMSLCKMILSCQSPNVTCRWHSCQSPVVVCKMTLWCQSPHV